jgi:hypothetical protein
MGTQAGEGGGVGECGGGDGIGADSLHICAWANQWRTYRRRDDIARRRKYDIMDQYAKMHYLDSKAIHTKTITHYEMHVYGYEPSGHAYAVYVLCRHRYHRRCDSVSEQ